MYYDKETKIWKCNDCYVTYKTKKSALAHVCKRVQSNLECPLCHEVFGYVLKRIRHEAVCPINKIPLYTSHDIIKYDMTGFTFDEIEKCFHVFNVIDGFNAAITKLLENPSNRNVKKKNLRDIYSIVYVGDGNWVSKPDFEVYPRLVYSFANALLNILTKDAPGKLNGVVSFLTELLHEKGVDFKRVCNSFKIAFVLFHQQQNESNK